MLWKVPVDLKIEASSQEDVIVKTNELLQEILKVKQLYRVVDYELPYDYPIECES